MVEYLFNKVAVLKKETPTQKLFCEYYEIFKSNFFIEHLRKAATGGVLLKQLFLKISQCSQETLVLEYLSKKFAEFTLLKTEGVFL